MTLELSDSEAFWMATLCRKMQHMEYSDAQWKEMHHGVEVDTHPEPYNELLDHAVEFGIARPPELETPTSSEGVTPPDDTIWTDGHDVLSMEEMKMVTGIFR